MQEAAFASAGKVAFYIPIEVDRLRFLKIFKNLRKLALDGFNVTVPYKEQVIPYLNQVTHEARQIGAVNTVFKKGHRWIGTNTDADGFLQALKTEKGFRCKGKTCFVLGAGGSSRAVVFALIKGGAKKIQIANRTAAKAKKIALALSRIKKSTQIETVDFNRTSIQKAIIEAELIVNTTAVGLKPTDRPIVSSQEIPKAIKGKKKLFFDLIYRPAQTPFLIAADRRGHETLNGMAMLLYQGALAWSHWANRQAPLKSMRQALHQAMT